MPQQDASGGVIFGSFFRYHGWLSPGVRLFRSISFPAKASWISLMFLVPLITMLWFIWSAANEQITATLSERDGITYVQPTLDLIKAAQGRRQAAMDNLADLANWQSQVAAAFDTLSATDKTLGTRLSTAEPFRALSTQHQKLLQAPLGKNADETFEEHNLLIQAALDLVHEVADSSQLTLDPAADTFFLMEFSVRLAPVQFENVAQLSALAQLVLKSGEMTPLRHDRLLVRFALLEFMEAQAESAYMKGIKNFAPQEQEFNMTGVDKTAVTFADTVKQLLESNRAQGDLASVQALGAATVDQQFKIDRQVLALLDNQLSARITELRQSFNLKLGLSLLFVFIAVYMMLAFYKVMMGGLREVSGHLQQITKGNLATTPRPWGSDEAAQLMLTMGEMEQSLRTIVRSVLDSAANVNTASEEIASASNDLSRRTEANAASLEETASSMVRISETVRHTSETVTNTSNIVRANAVSAEHGGVVISQVVNTMGGIQASSNKIGEIISVIEGIAFQTNILALNAAVEAARAGEQGRGFAVVATEVRALASRSAAAAKEIKALINESIDQVEKGGRVVMEAGNTIREIVANAAKINTLISDIAADTREQSTGVAQVGDAVNQLDQSTQQNAALVEETAAAATALAEQARRLADEVNFFKLK